MEVCSSLSEPTNKEIHRAGFDFSLCKRNAFLTEKHNYNPPKFTKTGTTIAGFHFKDGIIIGADTRSTSHFVADKNCEKIHEIAPNIYCCGAGTAADTFFVKRLIASKLTLLRRTLHEDSRVVTAATRFQAHLFKYHGYCQAALILGGYDRTGGHIYQISPEGAMFELPFATMGSGCLAAMSVIESEYHEDMDEEEAKALMTKAIRGGIFNDLGSGSNVDLRIIKKNANNEIETIRFRNYETPNNINDYRTFKRPESVNIQKGATIVLKEEIENIE